MSRRAVKRSPERREAILRALRSGTTRDAAAGLAEMSRSNLWRWTRADATFRDALAHAEAAAEARFAATVADAAFGRPAEYDAAGRLLRREARPDWRAAAWWLERRRRSEFAAQVNVDVEKVARMVADELGLDPEELLAETSDLVRRSSRGGWVG